MVLTFSKTDFMRAMSSLVLLSLLYCLSGAQNISRIGSDVFPDFKELPKINWTFKTRFPIYSSPVIGDELVYIGGLDSVLYALYIDTGKEKWKFHTNGEIRSNVCIDNTNLFLNGGDGFIYALDKGTGRLIWKFLTNGERKYDFADYFHSTPIIKDRILFMGSGDGNLYAINSITGTLIWKFKTGNIIHCTPAIDNNKIFFGSFDGYVYSLKLTNGEQIWKFKTVGHRYFPAGEVQGSPAVFNNIVYIGARDYNVYALDQERGYCHWNKSFTRGWGLCNNIHDSVLYIGSADERVLISADPTTGKEFWKINMDFLIFGNNAYSGNILFVGTTIGKLHAIMIKSGEKLWSFNTESYEKNRLKYFKPDDSYRDDIYSIIKSNEQFLEVECELGGIFSTPVIVNDMILFSSTNGAVYCLRSTRTNSEKTINNTQLAEGSNALR
jgi:outer membrane protein assembly factor BamB